MVGISKAFLLRIVVVEFVVKAVYRLAGPSTPAFTRRGRCVRDLSIPSKNDQFTMVDHRLSKSIKRSQQA